MSSKMTTSQPVGSASLDLSKAAEVEERLATAVQKLQVQARQLQDRTLPGKYAGRQLNCIESVSLEKS